MKLGLLSLLSLLVLVPSAAPAAMLRCDAVAVVELFTSQACSSCPAADAILKEIGDREDVIALAYHIDYWDYIGWSDTFARAANSEYQRAYARVLGRDGVYTPQMVVNGHMDVVGSRRDEVQQALEAASLEVPVNLIQEGDMLLVDIAGDAGLPESIVWLVTYRMKAEIDIRRGENVGRRLPYTHIVTGRQVLGMWTPDGGAQIKLPLFGVLGNESNGAAILVQEDKAGLPGRILGGASFSR